MVFLYRKTSGQVLGVSIDGTAYSGVDATYFASVQDPPTPNGADLAVAKRWDGTNLRNATNPEVSGFAAFIATDNNLVARAAAINRLQSDVILRKILRAIVGQMVTQLNTLRTQPSTTFAAITEAQAEQAIVDAINAGTFD